MVDAHLIEPDARAGAIRVAVAGIGYFVLVFTVGFLFGSLRVPLIEPRLGRFLATAIEAPLLVCAMFVGARIVTAFFKLSGRSTELFMMGMLSFCLVLIADASVGLLLRQMSFGEQLLYLVTPAGLLYLLLLIIFAVMPVFVDRWRHR